MRLFVAIPADEAVRADAVRALERLKKTGVDCKWVSPDNLHFTLHFFGDLHESMLDQVRGFMKKAAAPHRPFRVKLGAAGGFPSSKSPRIVWLGLAEGGAEMVRVAEDLAAVLRKNDFHVEERPFTAHLTLGRVRSSKGQAELGSELAKTASSAEMTADRLALVQSKLGSDGPTYVELFSEPLGGKP